MSSTKYVFLPLAFSLISLVVAAKESTSVDFSRDVLPILSENCFSCHGFDEQSRQGGLRLDLSSGATAEADSGDIAIVPGHPEDSQLIQRITSDDPDLRMPPPDSGKALSATQIQVLNQWIQQGAAYQKHWAFEKPVPPALPTEFADEHPIDAFVHAQLNEHQISPSEPADDETLLRRVSLDMTGLPPSAAQIDAFVAARQDNPQAAYERLVDELLSSPHYGERWGRWWLDQARYADSNGYSIDSPRQIWKFRDWVVEAFNRDLPFDQFTIEQLAGDLLPNASQAQRIATGFHRNTQINQEGGIDKEQFRIDSVFDRVATTGTVWLGLTIGCAQCHDHKFDPISQQEYYQLFAFFNNQDEPTIKVYDDLASLPAKRAEFAKLEIQIDQLIDNNAKQLSAWEDALNESKIKKYPRAIRNALATNAKKRSKRQKRDLFALQVGTTNPDFLRLKRRLDDLQADLDGVATTMVLQERKSPRRTTVFIKGDFTRPDKEVQPATPAILHELPQGTGAEDEYLNRLDLAEWIVSPDNPLTARVIVNRVWQVYFGRGLVETENDFGTLGTRPTHPQLLDWLATEFQKTWSLKTLHRLIVTSKTYQQSSAIREDLKAADPDNYLLGRQQRIRLDAEIIRDVCLSVSGLLAPKLGGPPVFPPIPKGVMNRGQVRRTWKESEGADRYRRGLYTFIYRATPPPSLNVFDAPDGFSTCTRRARSNTPLQALTLLNDQGFVEFAEALAQRIEQEGLAAVFRHCTGRAPTDDEQQLLQELPVASAARVLLNLDETVTRE